MTGFYNQQVQAGYSALAASAVTYIGQAATRSYMMNSKSATAQQAQTRSFHYARANLSNWRVTFPNFWINASSGELGTGGAMTQTATLEYPLGTIVETLKVGGSSSWVIPDNSMIQTDPISTPIPNGAKFFLRVWMDCPSGVPLTNQSNRPVDVNQGDSVELAATVTDKTQSGTLVNSGAAGSGYYPVAITSSIIKPSLYLLGDSKMIGIHDTLDISGNLGPTARAIGGDYGYINGGISSYTAQAFNQSSVKQVFLANNYCSHVVCQLGINDIRVVGSTGAQLISAWQTAWAKFTKPVSQLTLTPSASSTDSHSTLGSQSPNPTFEPHRVTANNYLRGGTAPILQTLEVTSYAESSLNSGLWRVNGKTNFMTDDGLHEVHTSAVNYGLYGIITPAKFSTAGYSAPNLGLWTPLALGHVADGGKLAKWFSMADRNQIGVTSAGNINLWFSKPDGVSVIQSTAASQPVYSRDYWAAGVDAAIFNGAKTINIQTADSFMANGVQDGWVFAVVEQNTPPSDATARNITGNGVGAGTGRTLRRTVSAGVNRLLATDETTGVGDTGKDFTGRHVVAGSWTGGGTTVSNYIDGAPGSPANTTAAAFNTNNNGVYIGSRNNSTVQGHNGAIQEVIYINGALTQDQIDRMNGYLHWTYGLQDNLPAGHPYKSAAPLA